MVPGGIGAPAAEGARESWASTSPVFHDEITWGASTRQNRCSPKGDHMTTDTLLADEEVVELGDVEELLVEEVSIDGLCGVY